MHLVLCPGGLPPLPLDLGPTRGVGVSLDCRLLVRERAPASPAPSGAGEVGVARSQRTSLARSPFLAALSTTWGIERDFGGPLLRVILSWFPIFGSRSTEG